MASSYFFFFFNKKNHEILKKMPVSNGEIFFFNSVDDGWGSATLLM